MHARTTIRTDSNVTPEIAARARRTALRITTIGGLLLIVLTVVQQRLIVPAAPWSVTLWGALPTVMFLMLAAPGVVWVAGHFDRSYRPRSLLVLVHLGALAAMQYGLGFLGYVAHSQTQPQYAVPIPSVPEVLFHPRLPTTLFYYVAMVGLTWGLRASIVQREQALQLARAQQRALAARLDALAGRLRPHVLFNTLHSVGVLLERDPARARTMMVSLGGMLRQLLDDEAPMVLSLADELELMERYLEIERLRFGDRLVATVQATGTALAATVPRLILQPLVENAIHHGLDREAGGTVEVVAVVEGDWLLIRVTNDGPHVVPAVSKRMGIGIGATRERLVMLWPEATIEHLPRDHGGMEVRVRIPDRPPTLIEPDEASVARR